MRCGNNSHCITATCAVFFLLFLIRVLVSSGGVLVSSGGVLVSSGGVLVSSGGILVSSGGSG